MVLYLIIPLCYFSSEELKQPRRRRQQKPHKFAYLTMKNNSFARFARAVFIFWHFEDVLVLSTTWNDLFCSCVDDVSIWWQMFNFVFLCPKRCFQFNSRIVRTHFSSKMTLNNWKMIAETQSYFFRWRSRFRRRRGCLSSLLKKGWLQGLEMNEKQGWSKSEGNMKNINQLVFRKALPYKKVWQVASTREMQVNMSIGTKQKRACAHAFLERLKTDYSVFAHVTRSHICIMKQKVCIKIEFKCG